MIGIESYICETFPEDDIRQIAMMYVALYRETGSVEFAQSAENLLHYLYRAEQQSIEEFLRKNTNPKEGA